MVEASCRHSATNPCARQCAYASASNSHRWYQIRQFEPLMKSTLQSMHRCFSPRWAERPRCCAIQGVLMTLIILVRLRFLIAESEFAFNPQTGLPSRMTFHAHHLVHIVRLSAKEPNKSMNYTPERLDRCSMYLVALGALSVHNTLDLRSTTENEESACLNNTSTAVAAGPVICPIPATIIRHGLVRSMYGPAKIYTSWRATPLSAS